MTELHTLALRTVMASFDGGSLPGWARDRLAEGMGGICLFGENVPSLDTVRDLCTAIHDAAPDAIVSLDEEGGDVTRLYYAVGSPHAGHAVLGQVDDTALTRAVARDIGSELREIGVDLDLGPVADVNSNPLNPVIGVRSFGSDPDLAARHVAAFVEGLQAAGVGAASSTSRGTATPWPTRTSHCPWPSRRSRCSGRGSWSPSRRVSPRTPSP